MPGMRGTISTHDGDDGDDGDYQADDMLVMMILGDGEKEDHAPS